MTSIQQTTLNTIGTQLQQALSASGSNNSQYLNSIFNIGASVGAIASDDPNAAAYGIQSLINTIMSTLMSMATKDEKGSAKRDVDSNSSNINNTEQKSKQLGEQTEAQIGEQSEIIDQGSEVISENLENIIDTQEEIAAEQEKVEKALEKIQELQTTLSGASADEQKDILSQIQEQIGIVLDSGTAISIMQTDVEDSIEAVEDASEIITTAQGNAAEIQANAESGLDKLASEVQQEIQNEVKTQTKGVANEATSVAAQTAAATASTNLLTGSTIAPQLQEVATDQGMAAKTRISGATTNLPRINNLLSSLSNNISLITTSSNRIGVQFSNYEGILGSYNSIVEPVITSIGSLLKTDTTELESAVQTDLETLGASESSDGTFGMFEGGNSASSAQKGSYDWFSSLNSGNNSTSYTGTQGLPEEDNVELLTPNAKIKAPTFGI